MKYQILPIYLLTAATLAGTSQISVPLHFEPNQGQTDPQVRFLSRAPGFTLFLTEREAIVASGSSEVRMRLVASRPATRITGLGRQPGVSHYLTGNGPAHWTTGVTRYARVRYEQVYPGVDLIYYGNQRNLEYDFVVAPRADYRSIRLCFSGAGKPRLESNGDLVLESSAGVLRQHKPVVYQQAAGRRKPVDGGYVLHGDGTVAFEVGDYDSSLPLIIDPLIMYYSGYLGGAGEDRPRGVSTDQQYNT